MSLISSQDLFLLEEIVKKNFSSKYKDSVLGILWTILSPLLMMALFTIIFSTIFARNIENFPVYFLCGWCLFHFFSSSISLSMTALTGNKSILKRNPAPKYIFVLGAILSEFLNYIIMFALMMVIMLVTNAPFYIPNMLFSIIPIISLFIMVTGLGLLLSIVCVYYTDVRHLWGVVSMMFMYASAIFYPIDIIPEPFKSCMFLNPLYWVIDNLRCFVYLGVSPDMINLINSLLLSLIILIIGIIVFKRYENKIAMRF